MRTQTLSKIEQGYIEALLGDPRIAERVFNNREDNEKYKICTVNDTGTVILGKTRFRWWNALIKCQDKIQFIDFALRVWSALVDLSKGLNKEAVLKGLSQEIIEQSVRDNNYSYVVNRLFDCWRFVAQESVGFQPAVTEGIQQVKVAHEITPRIILQVAGGEKTIPIVDSVGDEMRIGVKLGITGVEQIWQLFIEFTTIVSGKVISHTSLRSCIGNDDQVNGPSNSIKLNP